MNTIDLGLNIDQTSDIPVNHYWTPEVVKFGHYRDHDVSLLVTFENNIHREIYKTAFRKNNKIQVSGSKGKNPCICLTVGEYIIIIDLPKEKEEANLTLNSADIAIYFEDLDGSHVGVIKIRTKN